MSRSALALWLVALFALLVIALGWFCLREEPPASNTPPATTTELAAGSAQAASDEPSPASAVDSPTSDPARKDGEQARVAVTARTVHGLVQCEDGELPASGMQVALLTEAPKAGVALSAQKGLLAQSNVAADGSFEIGPLPDRGCYLHTEGGGYVQTEPRHLDPNDLGGTVILKVRRGAALEGLVHTQEGAPIAGAQVVIGNGMDLMSAFGMDPEETLALVAEGENHTEE